MKGKKIIVGISGSIAVYKTAILVRELVKMGAEVRCVATSKALEFVGGITFSTLSKNPILSDLNIDNQWGNHVELGLWGDAMIVAPATLNTLSKAASGICDNALMAVYFSAKCPVFFAPAMDRDMWNHPACQQNIIKLNSYGNKIIPVGEGELASGLTGAGRMAEVQDIIHTIQKEV